MSDVTQYVHNLTVTLNVVSLTDDGEHTAGWWCKHIGDWLTRIRSSAIVVSVEATPLHAYEDRTAKHKLTVGRDVIQPDSGEVLAEAGDTFVLPNPKAEHIIHIAKAHPHIYIVVENAYHTVIADASVIPDEVPNV